MQEFLCNVCKIIEGVSDSVSLIYHRHDSCLTILTAIKQTQIEAKVEAAAPKKLKSKKGPIIIDSVLFREG